jgi:hypothetical protein
VGKIILLIFLFLISVEFNCEAFIRKNKIEKIKEKYMKKDLIPDLWPVVNSLKKEAKHLFPVDQENTVGIIDGKTISLIKYKEDELSYKKITSKYVGSGDPVNYHICSTFDKDWIAFSVSRGVNLVNTDTKEVLFYVPSSDFYSEITHISPIPNNFFTFLIENDISKYPENDRVLDIVQFKKDEEFIIKSTVVQKNRRILEFSPLAFRDNIFFSYDIQTSTFEAFDLNRLEPTQHPLLNVLKSFTQRDISLYKINYLIIHPTMPFALVTDLLYGEQYGIRWWLIKWLEKDYKRQVRELSLQPLTILGRGREAVTMNLQFSPDGKWLIYLDEFDNIEMPKEPGEYIAIPIDCSYKNYMGKPVNLGKPYGKKSFCSSCWINTPSSFVAIDEDNIYKWDLAKLERKE